MTRTVTLTCGNIDSCEDGERHDYPALGETVTIANDGYLRIVGGDGSGNEAWYLAEGGSTATVVIVDAEAHMVAVTFGGPRMWADIDDDIRY